MGRGEVQKLSVVDGALNEGALTAGLIKSRCLVILSWFLFGKGNFFGFLIVAKIVSDNLANMGYTDAGEGLVQQLLARFFDQLPRRILRPFPRVLQTVLL